jgi:DNA-binding NtrC family response regulator
MSQEKIDLQGAKILVVDDMPANIDVLLEALDSADYEVLVATSGAEALETVGQLVPDLILLDIMMPEMDGFETCQKLKAGEASREIPVIFLTASDDTTHVVRGFAVGGVDYVLKPFQKEEVLARVHTHLERHRLHQALAASNAELKQANRQLRQEIRQRQALSTKLSMVSEREAERWGVEGFVGQSPLLQKILQNIKMLEQADSTSVLITGESGTGKELIARAFHVNSSRARGPFVPVNCATIPRDLAESLLFGHQKGAFTGAAKEQAGYFDLADGGTLFLDEVGDMPYELQIKLLRVLEDGQIMPLGANKSHPVDVRIVAATNADLDGKIQEGAFRQDLYYRIARFTVQVPALRQRREDIPLLAQHFLQLFAQEMGLEAPALGEQSLAALAAYDYPGNIRELKNIVERALIESQGGEIEPRHLYLGGGGGARPVVASIPAQIEELPLNYQEAEVALIERALVKTKGNITAAARLLEVDRTKIYRKLKQAGRLENYRTNFSPT